LDTPSEEVTCLQLSYGRPKLSQEAVECFIRQDYPHKKLIIVNTHHSPVRFNQDIHDKYDITVHNIKPLERLSDVYRYGLDLIDTPLFSLWDDDDLFLPWHLSERVKAYIEYKEARARKFVPDKPVRIGHRWCLFGVDGVIKQLDQNMFVAQYLYESSAIRPDAGVAVWDLDWEKKFCKLGVTMKQDWPFRPSYVYRWGTGEAHISSEGGEEGQHKNYLRNIAEKAKQDFDFTWEPYWLKDYAEEAKTIFDQREKEKE
jgi:hypothetical protein